MNYYRDEINYQLERLERLTRQTRHEASLNTLDAIRRIYRDMERNGEFNYDNAVEVLERLETIHIEEMERNDK